MLNFILIFLLCFCSSKADSFQKDEYNTYQWNKINHYLGNGTIQKNPWYEWWYYKIVLPQTGESFYSVYGVVNPWDKQGRLSGTRAYVGFGDFQNKIQNENKFSVDQFKASYDSTFIQVGEKNRATDSYFEGELHNDLNGAQKWSVNIKNKWSFNAMGWAMNLPGITNIAWYPAQADALCTGRIESQGKVHDFTDAPCYQDRNWGSSFPDWWAWIVSNHFNEEKDVALAVGGGLPEVLGRKIYSGVSVGLKFRGHEYTFRPQDLNVIQSQIKWGEWKVVAQNSKLKIEVEATAERDRFMDLQFTTPMGEIFHDYETLTGNLTLKIFERREKKLAHAGSDLFQLIATLTSHETGIEYGSKDEQKLKMEMYSKIEN